MRRKFLIAVLAFGTISGYAAGFASMRRCNSNRQSAFEQHVAKVCVDAARQSDSAAQRADSRAPTYAAPVVVNVNAVAPAVQVPTAPPAVQAPPAP